MCVTDIKVTGEYFKYHFLLSQELESRIGTLGSCALVKRLCSKALFLIYLDV